MIETTIPLRQGITGTLGILGWDHLDAVLLASLATEAPLLLIGPHGTAKSLLVERMAEALNTEMRHYNAALLNYDDLVGIPLPNKEGTNLFFVKTPSTIWGTGFVFFDEISRCRADLQNKLFPIIHERRVIGIKLDELKHRWAAMNPPAPENPDITQTGEYYLGSEPLDPALTDRFSFVIPVPNWGDLTKEDRMALVAWEAKDQDESDLIEMISACAALIPELESRFSPWLSDYVVSLMDLLEQAQLAQSPRRARMLARSVVAVHAARMILEGEDVDAEDSAELALIYGIPQTATEVPPSQVKLIALHKQAWEMAQYLEDENWRQVMSEYDMAQRVALADQLGFDDEDMSRLITQTIGTENSDSRQVGLAVAMFLAFSKRRNLEPSAYEPLAQLSSHVLAPRTFSYDVDTNSQDATIWKEIKEWIETQFGRQNSFIFRLQRNYLLHGFPVMWRSQDWKDALSIFNDDLKLFGIEDGENS